MPLIIVESPTKIKTLSSILGNNWSFQATRGHMYDLPEGEMGLGENYTPEWRANQSSAVSQLKQASRSNGEIYIASDPDREGEAIAWQVQNLVLNGTEAHRMRLESITEDEVQQQLDQPGSLDMDMVHAQWARRILDRLAGYKISPFLMNAFKGKKLSAGRVQTAVLAKIVEKQEAIDEFEPETFYNLSAYVQPEDGNIEDELETELIELDDVTIGTGDSEQLLTDEERAQNIENDVDCHGLNILECVTDTDTMNPAYPFDSSEMLRCASSWFGWPAGKTMSLAQSLYEKGLITYHRSDSNRISRKGCAKAASFIKEEYGEEYHQWRGGGGGDQEGHEAIRAKNPGLTPDDLKYISGDMKTLYGAIWQRYVQSQMAPATWNTLSLYLRPDTGDSTAIFRGKMRAIEEWGFFRCTAPGVTPKPKKEWSNEALETMARATGVDVARVDLTESETKGPRAFSEGSLIAMMKREGIGRPSTYSSTIEKLKHRQYIQIESGQISPTNRGIDVINFLRRSIPDICDVELTEKMEERLDQIAEGEENWRQFVEQFDDELEKWIEQGKGIEPEGTAETFKEKLDFETCPLCDSNLFLREGQYGKFVHCASDDCDFSSNPPAKTYLCPECERHMTKDGGNATVYYCLDPDCEGERPVGSPRKTMDEVRSQAPDCPECGSEMNLRKGRWGKFWGCSNYPDCEGTKPVDD
ncbi:MAG: type I DNA topoisomerase [bacterium]